MKTIAGLFVLLSVFALSVYESDAQSKGMDTQNQQIRDVGNGRGPADNGNRRDVGTGRGFDFGAGKTPDRVILSNPYRLAGKRDFLIATISDILRERNLILDESASRPSDGILITQPYTFAKGAVITRSELLRYSNVPDDTDSAWTRGRYTLTIEMQSIDGTNNNVSVSAKVEGRSESALGAQWLTLESSGEAENDFLAALVERLTGKDPNEVPKPPQK